MSENTADNKVLLDKAQLQALIERMAGEVIERLGTDEAPALIGIQRKGRQLAHRLKQIIKEKWGVSPDLGTLDITMHRDDLHLTFNPIVRESNIEFDINDREVVMIDDVLQTGRSVRAALNAILDYGRTRHTMLLVLVDRGGRELPIQPDICGMKIEAPDDLEVQVRFVEDDGDDQVVITEKQEE
jgi:pyrimidine operon attenuation protein/uracil phosphoribosyltransferase